MRYSCINGWTKDKMLEVIRARKYEGRAMEDPDGSCAYLAPDGNKCAVGLFIPEGHEGQQFEGAVCSLLKYHDDLEVHMPLSIYALLELQSVRDSSIAGEFVKSKMIKWVEENVYV